MGREIWKGSSMAMGAALLSSGPHWKGVKCEVRKRTLSFFHAEKQPFLLQFANEKKALLERIPADFHG